MRIALIDPPWHRLFGSHYNGIPLGVCYISSYLKKHSYETRVFNTDFLDSSKYLSQKQRMKQFENYLKTLNNLDKKIWKNITRDVLNWEPEVIGIGINQVTIKSARNLVKLLRKERPKVKIVFGGPQASVVPDLEYPEVDCVVRGEGELGMLIFLRNPNLMTIRTQRIEYLDGLPFPDREGLYYKGKTLEYGHVITGRGCPFNCIFCASREIWGRKPRFRGVKNVLDELNEVNRKFGIKDFYFRDDTFTLRKKRTLKLCKGLKGKGFKWQCDTRVDTLDREVVKEMKRAGCYHIKIGVESGNERILKLLNKQITKEQVLNVVNWAKEYGIEVTTYFILGIPTETDKELKDSINFAQELDPDHLSISIATPYAGTQLNSMMEIKIEETEKYFHQSPELIKHTELSPSLVEEFYSLAERKRKRNGL